MTLLGYLLNNPTAVVAAVATTIAILSLRSQRHLTKAKHTLDFDKDFKEKHKKTLIEAKRVFDSRSWSELRSLGKTGRLSERASDPFTALVAAINIWESVAIGIRNEVYLEKLLWDSFGSTVSVLYLQTIPFVKARQEENGRLFTNFVWLGLRWSARLSQPLRTAQLQELQRKKEQSASEEERFRLREEMKNQLIAEGWLLPASKKEEASLP